MPPIYHSVWEKELDLRSPIKVLNPMRLMPNFKRMLGAEDKRQVYCVPDNTIVFAIGDIHGQAPALYNLLHKLADFSNDRREMQSRFVFLGDYVDRGIDIASVFEALIDFQKEFDCIFLRGNHDQMMLDFFENPEDVGPTWVDLGGMETIAGYGIQLHSDRKQRNWFEIRDVLKKAIPASHIEFLEATQMRHEEGDFLFVHAGVNPNRPLDDQLDKDLMWIRDQFLHNSTPLEKMIVHGHTPTEKPVMTRTRIGVDTGVYLTGVLTAVAIMGSEVRFLSSANFQS